MPSLPAAASRSPCPAARLLGNCSNCWPRPPYRDQIDWSRVEFFWGDERAVPPDHADSNFRMANEALLGKLNVRPDQVHRLAAERMDREQAAAAYQAEIAQTCAVSPKGPPPALDLVLLGMGPDGHTASLFPHTTALAETSRWVVPNFVATFGTYRLTMTLVILNQAAHIMFLVSGEDKKQVLAEVLNGPPDSARLPSQLIQPRSGELLWLVTP